jgi:hypothetical protein
MTRNVFEYWHAPTRWVDLGSALEGSVSAGMAAHLLVVKGRTAGPHPHASAMLTGEAALRT